MEAPNDKLTNTPICKTALDAESYERLCKKTQTCYEVIPDDVPVCLYADIDSKHTYGEIDYLEINTQIFIDYAKKALTKVWSDEVPRFAVATASSPDYMDKDKRRMCYSIHIHIPNIKMMKNEQKLFWTKMNDFMNTNFEFKDWSEYLGIRENNFFDLSVYNPNGKLRSVYCSKKNQNRPLKMVEGTFKDTIVSLGDEDAVVKNKEMIVKNKDIIIQNIDTTIEEPKKTKNTSKLDKSLVSTIDQFDKIKQLCEIMDDKYFCEKGHYEEWRNILWSLRSESTEYKELARTMSRRPGANYDEDVFEATWKSYKSGKISIAYFYKYAKKSDPEKYNEIMNSGTDTRHCSCDKDAANFVYEDLKDYLKSYEGRIFFYTDNIWISDENKMMDALMYYILNSNIYTMKNEKTGAYSPYVQNISKARNVLDVLIVKVRKENKDSNLYDKFHKSTKGKICFNDGVLDFKERIFTLWKDVKQDDIFSTMKIDRNYKDYFENPDQVVIDEIKESVLKPLYGLKLDNALHFLSRALTGHHEDKRWATYLGNRNCGKGVEYDILQAAFQGYVSTFELGNIIYSRKSAGMENLDCSKKLYWLMDLEFVRLAVSQEIPESKTGLYVNSKIMKKITGGGDEIVARRNYDKRDTHFRIDTSFYIKGNYSLLMDSEDCGETRVEFESVVQFKSKEEIDKLKESCDEDEMERYKLANPNIKDKCRTVEWCNAMIFLIFESYKEKPIDILKEVDDEQGGMVATLKKLFEFTKDDTPILAAEVVSMMSEFDKKKLEAELSSRNIFKKKHSKTGEYRMKWCYYGLKKRLHEQNDEFDEKQ
jgi:hypothetical protein